MNNNSISITWLGQGGFLFEANGTRLLVDPFFSDIVEQREGLKRLIDPPLEISELNPNYVFITHDHLDHFDPISLPIIHEKYSEAPIIGPESVIKKAKDLDFSESVLHMVSKNMTYQCGKFEMVITPAYHSDPYSVGCLLKVNDKQIYLSADTTFSDILVKEIKGLALGKIDIILVCINGKLGNMNWSEAVTLVDQLQSEIAIPMHYGMFAENTEDPNLFIHACEKLDITSFELIPGIKRTI
ncbi:MBL fold metallo-hydrolase [Maribacter sp. ANRC-HE7]|uniref:MBL fold metallo-hydrolase n=1 Tax=Maribacter aquimaris TaxID=2737171 RepID=A0ABR7UYX4_9FLAO|nr:MBL fold metallo-hydrolase [Maribacter aquimaris]MBD0777810.1 MBL fold metallo-hydrolase [Maribacter aquimaris]